MCEYHHHEHEHEHNHEHATAKALPLRLAIGVVLLVSALFIPILKIRIVLFVLAYVVSGMDVLITALKNIKSGEVFDENFLMTIATLGAFAIKEYPEAIMVMILYQIGEYLQDKAVEKSKKSISELMDIKPDYANLENNGQLLKVSPEVVKINDIILVKAGEKIPLDGIVIDGRAQIDTSAITGEYIPRGIKTNDIAISGCINTNGAIKIQVTKEYHDSTVSKILELVEHAGSKKTGTEKFITKFARVYTPIVVAGALLLALIPPLVFGVSFGLWFERALIFLVISCPCALVISVPLAFFAGIGLASKNGILIKGSKYIELLAKPDIVTFDKTGTLTRGTFEVRKISPVNGISEEDLLRTAAIVETYSNHPIAISIKKAAGQTFEESIVKDVEEIAGKGVKVKAGDNILLAGNLSLMQQFGIQVPEVEEFGTIVFIARDKRYLGYITISDEIKLGASEVIEKLKKLKINTAILTGDRKINAEIIGRELLIDNIYSSLMPEDKVDKVEELKTKDKTVIFVGDGINDAPVLTVADIGIAMGGLGSDAAIEASDVVIMDDNLLKIPQAIKISAQTMRIAKQNIIFAIGIKIIFLVLGSVGFINLWGAVFADVGVTLIAVCNSLRILKYT